MDDYSFGASCSVRGLILVLGVFIALITTGCGDDADENPCSGVTCERGVCSAGACVNSTSCGGEDSACLDGYSCSDGDVCEANIACTDDSVCGGGTCENGACVNPEKCAVDDNCVPGDVCVDEACTADPCGGCDRGVCDFDTAACVDSDVCTTATEGEVCLEGSRCVQQACITEQAFCDALACDRGECDFEAEACVNPASCQGDDDLCLSGFYCADDNTCAENNCDAGNSCTMGVCDPATGDCINADVCTDANECTDGFVCITDSCVASENACDPACSGNQECVYEATTLSASCVESAEGCTSALDCTGERICDAGACADPSACSPDAYEPNESSAEATEFSSAATLGVVRNLTLCSSDTDVFSFDTALDPEVVGTLVVDVALDPADVGLGVLDVALVDSTGTTVASGSTSDAGTPTASARLEYAFMAAQAGEYTVEVSSADVTTAGVRYALSIDVVDPNVATACNAVQPLALGQPVLGDTTTAGSTAIVSSCGDADGTLNENLYALTVNDRSLVTVQLGPTPNADLVLSLRGQCTDDTSELQGACEDAGGRGDAETISQILDPGTYIVVVEPYLSTTGGAYTITATAQPSACTAADNTCIDATTASVCADDESGFDTVTCANACDSTIGGCLPNQLDACTTAAQVDAANPFQGRLDWANFNADYDPAGSCSFITDPDVTEGPDFVWEATVGPGDAVVATIEEVGSSLDNYSLYIVSDCADVSQCLAGANLEDGNGGTETVFWENTGTTPETVFVIADTDVTASSYDPVDVSVTVAPVVCTPGAAKCVINRESQICNPAGTGYDTFITCENGCDQTTGECITQTNDTCATPIALTPGVTESGDLALISDVAPDTGTCGGISSSDGTGPDAFYTVTANQNDTIEITVTASGFDPMIWLADGCNAGVAGACLDGEDASDTNDITEVFTFNAPTAGDYLFVVEPGDSGQDTGSYTITATVTPPSCDPGALIGCNGAGDSFTFCNSFGQFEDYACSSGTCSAGACTAPNGDTCYEPFVLSGATGSISGDFTGPFDDFSGAQATGLYGSCYFESSNADYPDGDDIHYAVNLLAGDTLTASLTASYSDTVFYLQRKCGVVNSCYGNLNVQGDHTINYQAIVDETVFLVVDSDTTAMFSSDTYTLDWNVTSGLACPPDTFTCIDGTTLRSCSSDGFSFSDYTCQNGCENDRCSVAATNDTCAGALDIGSGAFIGIQANDFTDTANPSCAVDGDGEDAFVSVTAAAGDIIRVVARATDTSYDATAYIFTDCGDIEGSCLVGDSDNGGTTRLNYQAQTTGTYYVALDRDTTAEDDVYFYSVEVVPPECVETDPITCNVAGDGIQYCANGFYEVYDCATTCTNAACDDPSGNTCFDPIPLAAGATSGTETGNWSGTIDAVNAGSEVTGACIFDDAEAGDGPDVIYSFNLAAGDTFEAQVDPAGELDITPYVVSDCDDAANTCVAADPFSSGGGNVATVAFRAETAGTYFLVIDRSDTSTTGAYSFDWQITSGLTCAPNQYACVDANTAGLCDSTGSAFAKTYPCLDGCVAGACASSPTLDDTCAGARTLAANQSLVVYDSSEGTNEVSLAATDCVGDTTPGNEVFYRLDLAADEIVDITSTSLSGESPALYIFTDCGDPGGSCLAGASGIQVNSTPAIYQATLSYQAGAAPESVIVAFDSEFSSNDEPFFVEVEKKQPNCVPGQFTQVCTADGLGFEYCDPRGLIARYDCTDANMDGVACASGLCDEPVGEVCLDPFEITPDATTGDFAVSGLLGDFSDDYSLGVGNACTGSVTPAGDAVHSVLLSAGETMTASLTSTEATAEDLALYVTADCMTLPSSCVGGSDVIGAGDPTAETVTYTATSDVRLYLIIDSFFSDASGGYMLDVNVQ